MTSIPHAVASVAEIFRPAFTRPSFQRFVVLLLAAILTVGARTVSNVLRVVGGLVAGHPATYHHLFSHRRWHPKQLARALARLLIDRFVPSGIVLLAGDDTVLAHPGRKVFGKGRHRDAVRSSHTYAAFRYGHKWVVLSLVVTLPFTHRPWALPLVCALYTTPEWDKAHDRRHKTPAELMRGLLALVLRWFPDRRFRFVGDAGFAARQLAVFAASRRGRLGMISRFRGDAALFAPFKTRRGPGRPRVRGERLPTPNEVVARTQRRRRARVGWYGSTHREVSYVSGEGFWSNRGAALVWVRWVHVRDLTGSHREEYFFSTDASLAPASIITAYTSRWSIEVTFQEVRGLLAIGSTRCRTANAVLREAPCLFGLYSVVVAIYVELPRRNGPTFAVSWPGKRDVTFGDALTAVRRYLWREWFLGHCDRRGYTTKLPRRLRATLLSALAPTL